MITDSLLWLREESDGTLTVGITAELAVSLKGVREAGAVGPSICILSGAGQVEINPPVTGQLVNIGSADWSESVPIARYKPGWKLDRSGIKM